MIYDVIAARALHIVAVVIWIGGVSLVTTAALPAIRRGEFGPNRMQSFEALERRFVWQARTAVIIVALTGLYMLWRLSLWSRFHAGVTFWWMHAMVCLWLVFALILFVIEPLSARRKRRVGVSMEGAPSAHVERNFTLMQWAHWVLLALSVVTVFGAVAGSHGWSIF